MPNPVALLVHKYGWIHLSLGLLGNAPFLAGSILLLPGLGAPESVSAWLFIAGASLMLVGAVGRLLVDLLEPH